MLVETNSLPPINAVNNKNTYAFYYYKYRVISKLVTHCSRSEKSWQQAACHSSE